MRRIFCCLLSVLLLLTFAGCSFFPMKWENTHVGSDSGNIDTSASLNTDTNHTSDSETTPSSDVTKPRNILKTPVSQLLNDEAKQLADYLFEKYIPCSFGFFTDAKNLSSPAVWSSVEALNRAVDGDESEASRKLENVRKKVAIYYPETNFDPEKVRVYDAATQTFAPSPADTQQYEMLSYEVKDNEITIYYQDKPEEGSSDEEVQQYATTLKNSPTEGYFSFVSSVKSGSVG